MATKTTMIHARMEPTLKEAAEIILKQLGLTATEAIRMFYSQIAHKKAIPFPLDLEKTDEKAYYTKVKSNKHLKELIGLKESDVSTATS